MKRNYNNERNEEVKQDRPQRRKRMNIDKDVELVIVNNTVGRLIYKNPRMSMTIDLESYGDEEYITVGDMRTLISSSRKLVDEFSVIITEVLDGDLELEDVLVYLGLERKYNEFFSLSPLHKRGDVDKQDIQLFLTKAPTDKFERMMESMDKKLRNKIIEISVAMFKLRKFTDYSKMEIIQRYVNEDLFDDAKETQIDIEL